MAEPIIRVNNLKKHFAMKKKFLAADRGVVRAVDDVSFAIYQGETFGLVGESGCGKTTVGRTIVRALEPTSGEILLKLGDSRQVDLARLTRAELRPLRRHIQMIYQDPYSSLSPRMTVKEIVAEPARISGTMKGEELDDRVATLLEEVGLKPQHMTRYPHAFSGGQRQRIGIARSLILGPKFIVADEPVSALDVSVQAQILELLIKLRNEFNLSFLFISHDLSVVKYICDRVGVMYVGKLFELADKNELFARPRHPYTAALLGAIPDLDPEKRTGMDVLPGEVADASAPPSGCYFHPRCEHARERCKTDTPAFRDIQDNVTDGERPHYVACHFAEELDLGVSY